jgi:hypothetical protein
MSNPSLLNIPYRFKTSKLYSQIPDSGLGDLTVTRATTPTANLSTRVNASGFIELVANNVPRLDYPLGGIANGCPGLLVEPSAQNAFIQSQTLFTSHLVQNLTTAGYENVAISPDGTQNAEKFVPNTTNAIHGIADVTSQTITSGTTYTFSCFAKSDGGTNFPFIALILDSTTAWGATKNAIFNVVSGTIHGSAPSGVTMRIENYGSGWYRFSATATAVGSVTGQYQYRIYIPNSSAALSYAAASGNTEGVLVWGAQLETGSVATSYIPTTTAPITRNADVISVSTASGCIGQSEGTIYTELDFSRAIASIAIIVGNSSNENFRIRKAANFGVLVQAVNTSGATTLFTSSAASAGIYKVAFGYKNGDYAMSVNGATVLTSNNSTNFPVNGLSIISLGETIGGVPYFNDRIRSLALYTTRLTNAQLQALTT